MRAFHHEVELQVVVGTKGLLMGTGVGVAAVAAAAESGAARKKHLWMERNDVLVSLIASSLDKSTAAQQFRSTKGQ